MTESILIFLFLIVLVVVAVAIVFVICIACEMSINKRGTKAKMVEDIELHEGQDYGYCPNCGEYLKHLWNWKHCGDCGQPVMWKQEGETK